MKELSVAATLAFRLAVMEVEQANHQYVEREHLLIGFCSLEKILMLTGRSALHAEDRQAVQSEYETIENVLGKFEMTVAQLRRTVRRKLGRGSYKRTDQVIHRSKACKQVFQRAEELAGLTEHVSCLHFLAALFKEPGEIITFTLQEAGVSPTDVQQHILTIISPQQEVAQVVQETAQELNNLLEELLHPERMPHPGPSFPSVQRAEPQKAPARSVPEQLAQQPAVHTVESPGQHLARLEQFTDWKTLKEDVLASAQEEDILREIHSVKENTQKQKVIMALDALADLKEGEAHGEKGYNVYRLSRILEVLKTRKKAIFDFLKLLDTPEHRVIVFRALLDLTDPAEYEYKHLIQRFLGLHDEIDEEDTLEALVSRAPTGLKGTKRVMSALHEINSVLSAEMEQALESRKDTLKALLEALDINEMRKISQSIGEKITFPLYIGLVFYAIAAKTQGQISVGNFLRKYICKEVPLFFLLGILNRNVLEGPYMRSTLVRPEIVDFPMDIAGSRIAIQETLQAFDETIAKSQAIIDKNNNFVIKANVEETSVKILFDTQGNITINTPVIIRETRKQRHIILAPQDGPCKVKRGKVIDATKHKEIPGVSCNIIDGTDIFLPNTFSFEVLKSSILHVIYPKGVVYGSPEPTENEIKAANELIDKQAAAETKRAHLLEGERPKPLRFKQLILLYIMKCALEQFYNTYIKSSQAGIEQVLSKAEASEEFQVNMDQNMHTVLALAFRISSQLSQDRSGGWRKFWELFATTIPEQLGKYIEMVTEFRNKAQFILPVMGIQRELGGVYWNIARLILIKGGNYLPPIPEATSPTGIYKEVLENIRQNVQTEN